MLTGRELNLVREAVARTRYELDDRKTAPGNQDTQRQGPDRISLEDAHEIRGYVRVILENYNKRQ
jgi:hypothetical protein